LVSLARKAILSKRGMMMLMRLERAQEAGTINATVP
jgi:hypothetical protein